MFSWTLYSPETILFTSLPRSVQEGLLTSSSAVMLADTGALKGWRDYIARVRVTATAEHPDRFASIVDILADNQATAVQGCSNL